MASAPALTEGVSLIAARTGRARELLGESRQLRKAGFDLQAVEDLYTSAELALEALAAANSVAIVRNGMSTHQARVKAAHVLRDRRLVPRRLPSALRDMNADRIKVRYEGTPSRFSDDDLVSLDGLVHHVVRLAEQTAG